MDSLVADDEIPPDIIYFYNALVHDIFILRPRPRMSHEAARALLLCRRNRQGHSGNHFRTLRYSFCYFSICPVGYAYFNRICGKYIPLFRPEFEKRIAILYHILLACKGFARSKTEGLGRNDKHVLTLLGIIVMFAVSLGLSLRSGLAAEITTS